MTRPPIPAVLSQLSQLSQNPAIRDALALLLGLTPPPAPATVCRYCGRGGELGAPLYHYLSGAADHGGFCPRRKKRSKK